MLQIINPRIWFFIIFLAPSIANASSVCEVIDGKIVCGDSLSNKTKRSLTKSQSSVQLSPSYKNPLIVEEFSLKRNSKNDSIKIIGGKVLRCKTLENLKEVCKEDIKEDIKEDLDKSKD